MMTLGPWEAYHAIRRGSVADIRENRGFCLHLIMKSDASERNKAISTRAVNGEAYRSIAKDFDIGGERVRCIMFQTLRAGAEKAQRSRDVIKAPITLSSRNA